MAGGGASLRIEFSHEHAQDIRQRSECEQNDEQHRIERFGANNPRGDALAVVVDVVDVLVVDEVLDGFVSVDADVDVDCELLVTGVVASGSGRCQIV